MLQECMLKHNATRCIAHWLTDCIDREEQVTASIRAKQKGNFSAVRTNWNTTLSGNQPTADEVNDTL